MPSITFIAHDESIRLIDAEAGASVMQAAVNHGVGGILADCGGVCACATCHCYIDASWAGKLPAPGDDERAMLDCVIDPTENSRLACQVKLTDELDGLVVRLPASQY